MIQLITVSMLTLWLIKILGLAHLIESRRDFWLASQYRILQCGRLLAAKKNIQQARQFFLDHRLPFSESAQLVDWLGDLEEVNCSDFEDGLRLHLETNDRLLLGTPNFAYRIHENKHLQRVLRLPPQEAL